MRWSDDVVLGTAPTMQAGPVGVLVPSIQASSSRDGPTIWGHKLRMRPVANASCADSTPGSSPSVF